MAAQDSRTVPDYFKLMYPRDQIARRIDELGAELSIWAREVDEKTGQQLVGICILRGGVFFFSDLLKAIAYTVEPSFCRARSYSSEENQASGELHITVPPEGIEGRHLLLIDDICDTGRTLEVLSRYCMEHGATEVRSAALIDRQTAESVYTPQYVGFHYEGAEWFAGYGMEDKNHQANYPDVYILES